MKKLKHISASAAIFSLLALEQGHAMHPPKHNKTEAPSPDHVPEREHRSRPFRAENTSRHGF